MMPPKIDGAHPGCIPMLVRDLLSRKRFRHVQQLLHIRRVHHPRYSYGWAFPVGDWTYFEARVFKDDMDRDRIKTWPGHWQQCPPDSYHDCTTTGRY
jgi:hypothetical protein